MWSKFICLNCCLQVVFAWMKTQICPIKKCQYEKCVIWWPELTRQISVLSWEWEVAGFKWHKVLENLDKKTDEWYIEWQPEVQQVATNDSESQRVTTRNNQLQRVTINGNEWQQMAVNNNEWQQMILVE